MALSPLKIAMLSTHSCPLGNLGARDTGGMSVYIRELAAEMGRQGHSVDIYTRVHDIADPQITSLGEKARLIHIKAGEESDLNKLALYSFLPDFACNLENFRKENDLHYDLIFSHYWLSGWVAQYLRQWWHVPHVAMFHTLGAVKNSLGIEEDETDLRIVTEHDTVKDCHHIIATTEREKQELISRYEALPEKISVVPCGVNLELFRPIDKEVARKQLGLAAGDKILLFVGRIEPLKGIDQLLKALPYLKSIKELRLMVIGGGEFSHSEINKLQQLTADLNVENAVSFPGLIKHEELPYYYCAADVCVVPSYYESFCLVALESLACGTPVVANDVGDLKSIIRQGETGYVLADNSPHHLADGITRIISGAKLKTNSPAAIRASVSRFNWSFIAEKVIRELRQVLKAGSAV